jgi:hypothetical protein
MQCTVHKTSIDRQGVIKVQCSRKASYRKNGHYICKDCNEVSRDAFTQMMRIRNGTVNMPQYALIEAYKKIY